MSNRTAVVTGGAQGIGKGITARLIADGFDVVLADADADAGRETADEFKRTVFVETDVSVEDSVQRCMAETIGRFGRLDVLVNNAGIADPENPPVESLALHAWNRVIQTNLTGAFLCTKHAVPHLRKRRGSVINISSTRALMSEPDTEAYAASKGGMVALTHALAISLGPEIRVNAISPGWIDVRSWKKELDRDDSPLPDRDHAQHPCGRVGRPEDIAGLVAYLVSAAAGFVTGQNIIADGGMTRKMIYE